MPPASVACDFRPHPLLPGGHLQTLAGLFGVRRGHRARAVAVPLADGDRLVLHDDHPPAWRAGGRVALLVHGLVGSFASGYLVRIAGKLNRRGVRTFRLDLRGCGLGVGLARQPFHSGRSPDVAAALAVVAGLAPASPIALAAFSLGGNLALKLLGERAGDLPPGLDRAVVVCPPIDLADCVRRLERFPNRIYDRHFANALLRSLAAQPPFAGTVLTPRPRGLRAFDQAFTAPRCGFADAAEYYQRSSALPLLPAITLPTAVLAAQDDPIVAFAPFADARLGPGIELCAPAGGGHLGFIAAPGTCPDRRWMDWWVVGKVMG